MTGVDTEAFEAKVKHMYRKVAERPDGDFHFELGEKQALRVGCDAERLATVPAEAVDSFAGVGFFFDRAGFEPREALGRLSGRRSRARLQSSKGPRPQACISAGTTGKGQTAPPSVANPHTNSSGRCVMSADSSVAETVVRNHLQAFLEQNGVDSIVKDYHEAALFYSEAKIYHGKQEIHGFFTNFIDSLPAGGISRFALRSLQVEGNVAYITWSVGNEIPLGTDTFVVDRGKIVSQTFAMHAAPAP